MNARQRWPEIHRRQADIKLVSAGVEGTTIAPYSGFLIFSWLHLTMSRLAASVPEMRVREERWPR